MRKIRRTLRHAALTPLLFCAAQASASGVNLGWNDCPGGPTYSYVQTFACDTNFGTHTLVGSFVAPDGVEAMSANEITILMQTSGALVSDWWKYGTGQCRSATSLQGNFDFTNGPSTCYDYWQGGAIGAAAWSSFPNTANRCSLRALCAFPAGDPRITSVPYGTSVYSFKIIINNAKSTGPVACTGCGDEACIALAGITIDQPSPNPPQIPVNNPAGPWYVLWQGWSTPDPLNQCPSTVPVRAQTWGSIKALYR